MKRNKSYKKAFLELKKLIDKWDPYDLIKNGAPEDEWNFETTKILAGLSKCSSWEDTAKLISDIFSESLDDKRFSVEAYQGIAKKAYSWFIKFKN